MKIFEESFIAGLKLKNRIIRSATYEGLAGINGEPTEELKQLYINLAKGGVSAIITGFVLINPDGKVLKDMILFYKNEITYKYKDIIQSLKEFDTPIILQIAHGGGQANPSLIPDHKTFSPSKHKYKVNGFISTELTESQLIEIIDDFVLSIEKAKNIGFDAVEIHAAHGYLLSEFLSPKLNRRTDKWGGSTENRCRIIKEIVIKAREKVGKYPILIKISGYDNDKNGMIVEESIKIAKILEQSSIDAIEVSCGNEDRFMAARYKKVPTKAILNLFSQFKNSSKFVKMIYSILLPLLLKKYKYTEIYNVNASEQIKNNITIPVIVVGGIRNFDLMEDLIKNKKVDYISMSRPFILEPDLVNKFKTKKQIKSRCINCSFCLIGCVDNPLKCYFGKA